MLNKTFSPRRSLSETEKSTLLPILLDSFHRIAAVEQPDVTTDFSSSEFTSLLSRDKLSHPLPEIFELCCILYCYHKKMEKRCVDLLLQTACFSLKL